MIRVIFIFLLLLGSIGIGIQLHSDAGYVLIALNHWTIEATVWVMLATILCIFLVLHLILLSLNWVVHIPQRWQRWRLRRKTKHLIQKKRLEKNEQLKQLTTFETTPEAYYTLGKLLEESQDKAGALTAYREGLKRAIHISLS